MIFKNQLWCEKGALILGFSGVIFQILILGVKFQDLNLGCKISGFKFGVSNFRYQIPDIDLILPVVRERV